MVMISDRIISNPSLSSSWHAPGAFLAPGAPLAPTIPLAQNIIFVILVVLRRSSSFVVVPPGMSLCSGEPLLLPSSSLLAVYFSHAHGTWRAPFPGTLLAPGALPRWPRI